MKGLLCSGRQRARSQSDKAHREEQILDAAAALFSTRRYDQLTLADVAAETGLTKAALYRYFRSKELLFIAVYRRAMSVLVQDMKTLDGARFPDQFIAQLLAHPLFCSLTAILHIALETGLTEQEARDFKLFLLTQCEALMRSIQAATQQSDDACFHYLMQCQQALIGCWHMSHPPEAARKAMTQPPLTVFQLDFPTSLSSHLRVLTHALMAGDVHH